VNTILKSLGLMKKNSILVDLSSRHDLHTHQANFNDDGTCSIDEIISVGQANKLSALGIVAHAHLVRPNAAEFVDYLKNIATQLKIEGWLKVGIEADIINLNGSIDTVGFEEEEFDYVMASMHYLPSKQDYQHADTRDISDTNAYDLITNTLVNAIRNPRVNILSHPFGYIYRNWHIELPLTYVEKIVRAAADEWVGLDMGSIRYRIPSEYELSILKICQAYATPLCLGSDAHRANNVGRIDYDFYKEFL